MLVYFDTVLLYRLGWLPPNKDPPACASQMLGIKMNATIPGYATFVIINTSKTLFKFAIIFIKKNNQMGSRITPQVKELVAEVEDMISIT